jgi:hypothetical protein
VIAVLPPGWRLGILVKEEQEDVVIGTLPVVALFSNGDITEGVVAMQCGHFVRISQLPTDLDVLCLCAPDEDVEKIARLVLVHRGLDHNVRLADSDESMAS